MKTFLLIRLYFGGFFPAVFDNVSDALYAIEYNKLQGAMIETVTL